MVLQLDIPVSTFTSFSMLVLGLSLFRISIKMKWPTLVLAGLFLSCLSYVLSTLHAQTVDPFIIVMMQAAIIHYLFQVRKLHSLMVAFLGALGYTIYLAIVLFLAPLLTHVSINDYFFGNYPSHRALKVAAAFLACLSSYILVKKRLGFTIRLELRSGSSRQRQNNALSIVFFIAFVLFSLAYYAVMLHMAAIFFFAASFCILLAWILYLLFKKEMEDH